jgi:hypothetical protein
MVVSSGLILPKDSKSAHARKAASPGDIAGGDMLSGVVVVS